MSEVTQGRLPGADRPAETVEFTFAGETVTGYPGETIAAALWAARRRALRTSRVLAEPRGIFCNMGICYECLVRVEGREVRACMTPIRQGVAVEPAE